MSAENLNSINTRAVPLPEIPQAVGELIAELLEEEPDAVVIDRLSRQVLVYPKGSASDRPTLGPSSITSLLSEYTVHMVDDNGAGINTLLSSESRDTHVALFCHPSKKRDVSCHMEKTSHPLSVHETRVVSPNFLLLCCRETSSGYRLKGMMLES